MRIDLAIRRRFFYHPRHQPVGFDLEYNDRSHAAVISLDNGVELFGKAAMNKPLGLKARGPVKIACQMPPNLRAKLCDK